MMAPCGQSNVKETSLSVDQATKRSVKNLIFYRLTAFFYIHVVHVPSSFRSCYIGKDIVSPLRGSIYSTRLKRKG